MLVADEGSVHTMEDLKILSKGHNGFGKKEIEANKESLSVAVAETYRFRSRRKLWMEATPDMGVGLAVAAN